MTFEQIAQLKDMGFSPEQIMRLTDSQPTVESNVNEESKIIEPNVEVATAEVAAVDDKEDKISELSEKLDALTNKIHLENIQNSELPSSEPNFIDTMNELIKLF